MTLYQFKFLKEQDRYQIVWEHGVFLDNRTAGSQKFVLYQVDGFYVEISYNANRNKITGLKSFVSLTPLEPYLRQVDITTLL